MLNLTELRVIMGDRHATHTELVVVSPAETHCAPGILEQAKCVQRGMYFRHDDPASPYFGASHQSTSLAACYTKCLESKDDPARPCEVFSFAKNQCYLGAAATNDTSIRFKLLPTSLKKNVGYIGVSASCLAEVGDCTSGQKVRIFVQVDATADTSSNAHSQARAALDVPDPAYEGTPYGYTRVNVSEAATCTNSHVLISFGTDTDHYAHMNGWDAAWLHDTGGMCTCPSGKTYYTSFLREGSIPSVRYSPREKGCENLRCFGGQVSPNCEDDIKTYREYFPVHGSLPGHVMNCGRTSKTNLPSVCARQCDAHSDCTAVKLSRNHCVLLRSTCANKDTSDPVFAHDPTSAVSWDSRSAHADSRTCKVHDCQYAYAANVTATLHSLSPTSGFLGTTLTLTGNNIDYTGELEVSIGQLFFFLCVCFFKNRAGAKTGAEVTSSA